MQRERILSIVSNRILPTIKKTTVAIRVHSRDRQTELTERASDRLTFVPTRMTGVLGQWWRISSIQVSRTLP